MPQIAPVPILDPVQRPLMSPREAGKAGLSVAEMGEEAAGIADVGLQLEAHIREAQKTVDKVASQNQYAAADEQFQIELRKTQNSRDIEAIVQKHQDELNQIAKNWSKSPAAMEIQMYGDSLRPRADHLGQMRQIDLMGKEWNAQTDLQLASLTPQFVAATRSGDRQQAGQILSHVQSLYDDAVSKGLISPADKALALDAFQIAARKQLNEAAITSGNPAERLAAISQLKSGGSGPLDLTNLAAGDISALRVHAEEMNERLDHLSEAQKLNRSLNIIHNAFQAPEFRNNFEAQQNALADGDWLTKHGIVAEDGSPDRVMAEKLAAESTRQEEYRRKAQADRDEKVVSDFSARIDENKVSRADIDMLPGEDQGGISNRARAMMIRQWTENWRINRQMAVMDRQEAERSQQQLSDSTKVDFYTRITSGELVDPLEVRTSGSLTKGDKAQVLGALQAAKAEPDFRGAISILNDAIPVARPPAKGATPEQQEAYAKQNARQTEDYNETLAAYNAEMKAHPGENKQEAMRKVLEPQNHKRIADMLDKRFGVSAPATSSTWKSLEERLPLFKAFEGRINTLLDQAPASTTPAPEPATPKIGDTKTFPNGRTGKWDGKGWVAQ